MILDLIKQKINMDFFEVSYEEIEKIRRILYDDYFSHQGAVFMIESFPQLITHIYFKINERDFKHNLQKFKNLQTLCWDSNEIAEYPFNFFSNLKYLDQLKHLSISINFPDTQQEDSFSQIIDENLQNLSNLETFSLEIFVDQNINKILDKFFVCIPSMSQLKHLKIALPELYGYQYKAIKQLWPNAMKLEKLETLEIDSSRNNNSLAIYDELKVFTKNSVLSQQLKRLKLNLSLNFLEEQEVLQILNAITPFQQLEEFFINIDVEFISERVTKKIQKILNRNQKTLRRLQLYIYLKNNIINYRDVSEMIRNNLYAQSIGCLQQLEELAIYSLDNLELLGQSLLKCTKLRKLTIISDFNNISNQDTQQIISFFNHLQNMQLLTHFSAFDEEELFFSSYSQIEFQFTQFDQLQQPINYVDPYLISRRYSYLKKENLSKIADEQLQQIQQIFIKNFQNFSKDNDKLKAFQFSNNHYSEVMNLEEEEFKDSDDSRFDIDLDDLFVKCYALTQENISKQNIAQLQIQIIKNQIVPHLINQNLDKNHLIQLERDIYDYIIQ